MALINKIREKSGWAVGAIAIGLLCFMVLGDLLGPNSRLLGNNRVIVGEVAGEEITYQEFERVLEEVKQAYISQSGRQPTDNELYALREQAWNQIIFRVAFQQEFDRLGLVVTDDELDDMVRGNNIHPAIRQSFTNPQTGEFDRAMVVSYLGNLQNMPPEQRVMWYNFEANLRPDRLRNKYYNLFTQSNFITSAEAARYHEAQNSTASMRYLYVPFAALGDSGIAVTDAQLRTYLQNNKHRYQVEAGRSVEYVTIPSAPSTEDTAAYREDINSLIEQLKRTENDSLFVRAHSDAPYSGNYLTVGELPENLQASLPLQQGTVYGPFAEGGMFVAHKITDVRAGDVRSVRASHILIRTEGETPEAKSAALNQAREIIAKIRAGGSFEALAREFGTDGTASVGGDLGWFTEGRMVPAFERAVFGAPGPGLLPAPVETEFGFHVIQVTAPASSQTFQVATLSRSITPSDATRDEAFRRADLLASTSRNIETFRANAEQDAELVRSEARMIGTNDRNVNNLSNARELIRWAYAEKTNVGDVSPVFEIDDQFVVAVLTAKREKGTANLEDVREEVAAAVRNEVKGNRIVERLSGLQGTLDEMATAYGAEATVRTADGVTLNSVNVPGLGLEPEVVGKVFGLQAGNRSAPFVGQSGVFVVEQTQLTPAPAPENLVEVKSQLAGMRTGRVEGSIYEAIREKADIKDNRHRFF
jgi:peptidyl-prolyl cis-trans isomerase D